MVSATTKEGIKKLRVLCLHGWNSDKIVMKFQLRHLTKVFGDVVDFIPINGLYPVEFGPYPELKSFLPEGQKHHYAWLKFWKSLSKEE